MTVPPEFPRRCAERYRPEGVLGSGGCGTVWRACQLGLARPVAVKVLTVGEEVLPEGVARFRDEAKIGACLRHPHIVQVLDHDIEDGRPWIVYELIEGPSLATLLERGPLPLAQALDVARQVAAALEALHARGVIHRDIKPANVMQAGADLYKVTDFGVAKWILSERQDTMSGLVLGTPGHVAPELLAHGSATPAADVYAVGILLFQMLAGRHPFDHNLIHMLQCHARGDLPAVDERVTGIPPTTAQLVRRMMATVPAARPAGAEGLREAIEQEIARGVRPAAPGRHRVAAAAGAQVLSPPPRRRPTAWAALLFLAAALAPLVARRLGGPAGPVTAGVARARPVDARVAAVDLPCLRHRLEGLCRDRVARMPEFDRIWDVTFGIEEGAGALPLVERHRELNRADIRVLAGLTEALGAAADTSPEAAYLGVRAAAELCVMQLRTERLDRVVEEAHRIEGMAAGRTVSAALSALTASSAPADGGTVVKVRGFLRALRPGVAWLIESADREGAPADGVNVLADALWVGEALRTFTFDAAARRMLAGAELRDLCDPCARAARSERQARLCDVALRSWSLGKEGDPRRYEALLREQIAAVGRLTRERPDWAGPLQLVVDHALRDRPGGAAP